MPRSRSARVAERRERDGDRLPAAPPAADRGDRLRVPRRARRFRVRCLGRETTEPRPRLIQDFFRVIERYTPQLVSWNGGGFDLPVLHYRGLRHGVVAEQLLGPRRGRPRVQVEQLHQPLPHAPSRPDGRARDVPAARQRAARRASRKLCGFPGKLGMDGSQVLAAYQDGRIDEIRALLRDRRRQHLPALLPLPADARRAVAEDEPYREDVALVRAALAALPDEPHWREYLDAWPAATT